MTRRLIWICLVAAAGCGGPRVDVNGPVEPLASPETPEPARASRPSPVAPVLEASNIDLRRRTYEAVVDGALVIRGGTVGVSVSSRTGAEVQSLGRVVLPGSVAGLALVRPGLAVAGCGNEGLFVVDLSNPAAPRQVGHLDTPWSVLRLHGAGDQVLAADGAGGVAVIDLSRPASPREAGRWASEGFVLQALPWRPGLALVAEGRAGVAVLDVSDPAAPALVSRLDTEGEVRAVAARDDLAFAADFHHGVVAVDVTDPASPRQVGRIETPDSARDVLLVGDVLAVAVGVDGVLLVSADPAMATLGRYETGSAAVRLALAGDRLAVVNESVGVEILDVSAPARPVREAVAY
jgi:hypothetical protein